jgi:hypothetical protein
LKDLKKLEILQVENLGFQGFLKFELIFDWKKF